MHYQIDNNQKQFARKFYPEKSQLDITNQFARNWQLPIRGR